MTRRLPMLRALMLAALTLLAVPAMAQDGARAAAPATTAAAAPDYLQPACAIRGRVAEVAAITASPAHTGAPSTLSASETRITVAITARHPQNGAAAQDTCPLPASGTAVYKLCAPVVLKKGDEITGVEGVATGGGTYKCLFDIAPPAQPQAAPAAATP